jgi:hypothetical protein
MAKPFLKKTIDSDLDVNDIQTLLSLESKTVKYPKSSDISDILKNNYIGNLLAPVIAETIPKRTQNIEKFLKTKTPKKRPIISNKFPNIGPSISHNEYMQEVIKPTLENYVRANGKLPSELSGLNINRRGGMVEAYLKIINKNESSDKLNEKLAPYKVDQTMKKEGKIDFSKIDPGALFRKIYPSELLRKIDPSVLKGIKGALAAAIVGAGFGGVQEAGRYIKTKKENEQLRNSWSKVSDRLKNIPQKDLGSTISYKKNETMERASEIFKSLANFAPSIAKDPVIGASVVNSIIHQSGTLDTSTIKTLVDIQKGIRQSQEYRSPFADSPFIRGMAAGFGTAGGSDYISQIPKVHMDLKNNWVAPE